MWLGEGGRPAGPGVDVAGVGGETNSLAGLALKNTSLMFIIIVSLSF